MAQLIDTVQTQTTVGLTTVLTSILKSKYNIKVKRLSTPTGILKDKPLLVMCHNYSRIATDIKSATESIGGIPDHLVAVVIIHAKATHSLPTQKTSDIVEDEQCKKYGLLVDFAYLDGSLLDCVMNKNGLNELHCFLDNHIGTFQLPFGSTAKKPKSEAGVRRGSNGAIQLYLDPDFHVFLQTKLNIPAEFQVVSSVTNLRKENMWIVVCKPGSFQENHVRRGASSTEIIRGYKLMFQLVTSNGFSQNAKILVLIDDNEKTPRKDANTMLWAIKLSRALVESTLLSERQHIINFIQTFIDNDIPDHFFEECNKRDGRVEAYTDDEIVKENFDKYFGIKAHVVQSVTELTKLDPRILWVIVYKEDSPLLKEFVKASPSNATVLLRLDKNDCKKEIQFEPNDNGFLLMGSLCRSLLPLNDQLKDQMEKQITELMTSVQTKLLKEPLEKFLEPMKKKYFGFFQR